MYIAVSCGLVTAVFDGALDGAVYTDWTPPDSLMDERNVYRYKYADGAVLERTAQEMDADYARMPKQPPRAEELLAALVDGMNSI